MHHIGTIKHPVNLVNNKVAEFSFDYFETENGRYAIAYMGDIEEQENVLLRIESACIFGHVFGVARCDCQYQLAQAMVKIAEEGNGLVVYAIDQDCRGLGIDKHFEVYVLRQHEHLETKGVYERLNEKPDARDYTDVIAILNHYKIKSVRILTNNPRRLNWLENSNIGYTRIPLEITLNANNQGCLMDEKKDLGYLFSFKTHDEWINYLHNNLRSGSKPFGCLVTSNFKYIICECYDEKIECFKLMSEKLSGHEDDFTVYVSGEVDEDLIEFCVDNKIKKIYAKKDCEQVEYNKKVKNIEIELI